MNYISRLTTPKLSKTLIAAFSLILLTGLGAAQTITQQNDATNDMGPGDTDTKIYEFTFTADKDTAIQGSPTAGDSLTTFEDSDNTFFVDDQNDGWDSSQDNAIFTSKEDFNTYEESGRSIGGTIT